MDLKAWSSNYKWKVLWSKLTVSSAEINYLNINHKSYCFKDTDWVDILDIVDSRSPVMKNNNSPRRFARSVAGFFSWRLYKEQLAEKRL